MFLRRIFSVKLRRGEWLSWCICLAVFLKHGEKEKKRVAGNVEYRRGENDRKNLPFAWPGVMTVMNEL